MPGDSYRMASNQNLTSKAPKLPVHIRQYVPADVEQVHEINQLSLEISFRFYFDLFHRTEPELFLVAEHENKILGFILVKDGENFGEKQTGIIYAIAVSPNYRSSGIGSQLVNTILNVLRAKHIKKLFLHVRVGNEGAIRFYFKLGFTKLQTIKEFYSWGEDADRMVKIID